MDADLSPWPRLELVEPVDEGSRNEVWRATIDDQAVAVRRSRRSEESLAWELDLIEQLAAGGLRVAKVISTSDGRRHHHGVVVQRWLEGRPPESEADWALVADALRAVHDLGRDRRQRPGCVAVAELNAGSRSVDADMSQLPREVADELLGVFAEFAGIPTTAIHGDPSPSNLRIDDNLSGVASVGLLDFDESRVDIPWHDLSNLGVRVLNEDDHSQALRLSDAWEAANAWVAEPEYARSRLTSLRGTSTSRAQAGKLHTWESDES